MKRIVSSDPMLTRRSMLLAAAGSGASSLVGTAGCKRGAPTSSTPTWPRTTQHDGVEMIELFPRDADESSPLIVAIHGMGGRPEHWVPDWKEFPGKAQIALPRAFDAHGQGFSWFQFKDGMTDEQFGAEVGASEARLWKGIAHLAGKRRVIVTGFSQGGILSFAIAARHADAVIRAFPVAGSCPGPILPKDKARSAPLSAFHGTTDTVLNIKWGREAVKAFKDQGNDAELKEYEGVGHTLTAQMRADVWAAIGKVLPPG